MFAFITNSPKCKKWLALILLIASTSACSLYRVDVQQGNVITQEMVYKLRPGMTRAQVQVILGTPLLQSVFHTNRWDFVYHLQRGNGARTTRHLGLLFDRDGYLERVDGDVAPSSPDERIEANQTPKILEIVVPANKN